MGRQGKLPLDSDKGRLNLSIEAEEEGGTPEEAQNVTETDTLDENSPEEITSPSVSEEMHQEAEYISAEEMATEQEDEHLTLGDYLRNERMRRDLTLHDVADQIRIRPKQIEALESGDYDSLPGHTFVAGFLRSYANLLQLDATIIVDLYKSESRGGQQAPELAFPEPTSEGRVPGMGLIMGSIVLIAGLFAGWYFYLSENQLDLEIVSTLPAELQEKVGLLSGDESKETSSEVIETVAKENTVAATAKPETEDAAASNLVGAQSSEQETNAILTEKPVETTEVVESSEEPQAVAVVPDRQKAQEDNGQVTAGASEVAATSPEVKEITPTDVTENATVEVSENAEAEVAETSDATKEVVADSPTEVQATPYEQSKLDLDQIETTSAVNEQPVRQPETLGVENVDSRIVLVANHEAWVQVKDASEAVLMDRVLEPGDTYMLPNQSGLTLSTANAGGVEIRLDGENLGSLGSFGHIVQSLPLVAEELKEKLPTVQ